MNAIQKLLKQNKKLDARLLQARISKPIYDKLRAKLKRENVTIQDFMEAAALAYMGD